MAPPRSASLLSLAFLLCSFSFPPVLAAAATDCTTALSGLSGCLTFLSNTSSTPDAKTCCAPLESVLNVPSSFQCICAEASSSSPSSANVKNALLLPKACKLSIDVSEANCTQSSSSSNSSSTASSPNAGFKSASPISTLLALAIIWSFVSFVA